MKRAALPVLGLLAMLACHPAAAVDKAAGLPASTRTQILVDQVARNWLSGEWQAYATRFVTPDGRVTDNGNDGISHSEGQGYGLLLAAKAGDAARFETIWRWTEKVLLVRPDGLAAWRWDPAAKGVADLNNATDGDILIAWGLAEGAKRFARPDYRQAAERIAKAVGAGAVAETKTGPVLLPGVKGFGADEQPDGPVVNLSYWVLPAFPALAELAPSVDWAGLRRTGLALLEQSRFGRFALPTDWLSLAEPRVRPAGGFQAAFGYNAIRIPLYLAMDGGDDARRALRRFTGGWTDSVSPTHLLDAKDAPVTVPVGDPGYALVLSLARCASGGRAIPPELINTRSNLYYPETLRLLSVIAIEERTPACL